MDGEGQQAQGGSIKVRTETSENEIRISTDDTGIGIAPENQSSIFDPFYQVRAGGSGSRAKARERAPSSTSPFRGEKRRRPANSPYFGTFWSDDAR